MKRVLRKLLRGLLALMSLLRLARKEGKDPAASRQHLRHLAVADAVEASVADPAARVLDMGCGEAALSRELSDRGYASISGCDWLAPEAVRHGFDALAYRRVDLNEQGLSDYGDASFDLVVASDVVEHLQNPAFALAEIARVLRPGGTAVVSIPNAFNLFERFSWLFTGNSTRYKSERTTGEFGHISVLPGNVMRSLAARAGLKVVRRIGGYCYLDGYFILPSRRHSLKLSYNEIWVFVR